MVTSNSSLYFITDPNPSTIPSLAQLNSNKSDLAATSYECYFKSSMMYFDNIINNMARLSILIAIVALFSTSLGFQILTKLPTLRQPPSAINWPFQVCGAGPWIIKSLTMSANPSRNLNDDIIAVIDSLIQTGNAKDHIEFDHVDLDVKLNGLFLHSETIGYKDEYDEGDTVTFKYTNFIPSFAPSGTYLLTFNFKGAGNVALGCLSFNFKL